MAKIDVGEHRPDTLEIGSRGLEDARNHERLKIHKKRRRSRLTPAIARLPHLNLESFPSSVLSQLTIFKLLSSGQISPF